MSLLQHRDESFRNITATWGGLQRSQAALICSAGKTSPPCPSPALLPPGQRVSRGASERWHKPTRTGHEKESKEWALKKKINTPAHAHSWSQPSVQWGWGCSGTEWSNCPRTDSTSPDCQGFQRMDCRSLHRRLWRTCQTKPNNSKIPTGRFFASRPNTAL